VDCTGDAGSILGVEVALLGVAGAILSPVSFDGLMDVLVIAAGPVGAFGGGNIFVLTGGPILTGGMSITVCRDGGPTFNWNVEEVGGGAACVSGLPAGVP
jgi:hypothetical protein